jgi:hypothetical protein
VNRKITTLIAAGTLAGALAGGSVAGADVYFDAETGTGSVGKGDVQSVFDWNDHELQDGYELLAFRYDGTQERTQSWVCTNANNGKTQERHRTTTTTSTGDLSWDARTNSHDKVTGFELTGYAADAVTESTGSEGPAVDSCPSGPWSLTTPAGDPVVSTSGGGLQVSADGETWIALP